MLCLGISGRSDMAMYIILCVTAVYITVVVYLYLTAEMPDLPDWEEDGRE